jgi:hypothetical protein
MLLDLKFNSSELKSSSVSDGTEMSQTAEWRGMTRSVWSACVFSAAFVLCQSLTARKCKAAVNAPQSKRFARNLCLDQMRGGVMPGTHRDFFA